MRVGESYSKGLTNRSVETIDVLSVFRQNKKLFASKHGMLATQACLCKGRKLKRDNGGGNWKETMGEETGKREGRRRHDV